MNPSKILTTAREKGIRLTTDGEKIRYEAPPEAMTPEMIEAIRDHKAELILQLSRSPEIEPIKVCLHNKTCRHLSAPGKQRPECAKNGTAIFDLLKCPMGLWRFYIEREVAPYK